MTKPRIAIVVGSNRRESINRKLAEALGKLVPQFDLTFSRIDDLPMFNLDDVAASPAAVKRFKSEIDGADGVIFVTPEYNRSIPALLKNAIDWGSMPGGQNSWADKPVFITGTSPGAIGSALAQQHLRHVLGAFLGALVLGGEAYITFKPDLINAEGEIGDEATRKFLGGLLNRFGALVARHAKQPERSAA
jgi:chromate reductase